MAPRRALPAQDAQFHLLRESLSSTDEPGVRSFLQRGLVLHGSTSGWQAMEGKPRRSTRLSTIP